jgi:hypothetical protein
MGRLRMVRQLFQKLLAQPVLQALTFRLPAALSPTAHDRNSAG